MSTKEELQEKIINLLEDKIIKLEYELSYLRLNALVESSFSHKPSKPWTVSYSIVDKVLNGTL